MATVRMWEIGVLGAGAMGSGIAQVAAAAGHPVIVVDASLSAMEKARDGLRRSLARGVEKKRLTSETAQMIESSVRFEANHGDLRAFAGCRMVIEAIVEDLDAKRRAFQAMEAAVSETCILATNTSSLSVTAIASACKNPQRVIGLHFFNPVTVLPLVEAVAAISSDPVIVSEAAECVGNWDKDVVEVRDTPGFIVNRVARPFYGESLRIYEEGISDVPTIDWAMKEFGGFKMGPFELMDLIGNDVNYAVTTGIFEAFYYDPRYRPSLTQRRMVEAGRLGKKTGVGYYDYRDGAKKPEPRTDRATGARIFDRVIAMLVNEAADAAYLRVATKQAIDHAMVKGVNYPKGLLAWGDEIGVAEIHRRMVALQEEYGEDRYRPSQMFKRCAASGERLYL
jgi:3-hydroxybutyryl-CoA dehydrogenase